jgi:hypothetical protein
MSLPAWRASSMMLNMQWLREDAWFIGVSEIVRLVSPRNSCGNAKGGASAVSNHRQVAAFHMSEAVFSAIPARQLPTQENDPIRCTL